MEVPSKETLRNFLKKKGEKVSDLSEKGMLVRRYQGRNEEEAIAKAKAELGLEAIILHIKQLSKNGIFDLKSAAKVEVIVALDQDLNEFRKTKPLVNEVNTPKAEGVGERSEPKAEGVGERSEQSLPSDDNGGSRSTQPYPSKGGEGTLNERTDLINPAGRGKGGQGGCDKGDVNHVVSSKEPQNSPLAPAERFRAYAISTYSNIKEISEPRAESQRMRAENQSRKPSGRQFEVERSEPKAEGVGERSEQSEVPKSLGAAAQELYQHLLSHEVQGEVAQRLSLSIQELLGGDSSLSLKEAMNVCIEELIRTSGGLNISQKPSVVAFIGPTGVGKTTTIAKLAAHYHLRENQRISLITADTYRIAAIEQLKTYATYIGIPLEVALTPQEMHQLVRKHKNCDLILIDTPGRSQKDSFRIQELKMILSAASPQEVHLLLNVTTQHRVLWDVVRGFKVFSPNRLLFTKLDESACFGHILNLSVALGEPVSYLTTGQEVPDDIQLATIERITEYLLREGDVLS